MSGNKKKKADQTAGRECDGKGCKMYKASISINEGCRSYLSFLLSSPNLEKELSSWQTGEQQTPEDKCPDFCLLAFQPGAHKHTLHFPLPQSFVFSNVNSFGLVCKFFVWSH